MNELKITIHNGIFVADSREVAEMVVKLHKDLLETIRGYEQYLTGGNYRSLDFFIPATYQDAKGENRPCYLITRRGCDMVVNKMSGEKGVLFTAAYVTKFEEMEKQLSKTIAIEDVLIASLQSMKEIKLKQVQHDEDIKMLAAKIKTHPEDYFSISGYASLRGIRVDISKAKLLGIKASEMSREYEVDMGKVTDPRFGQVNTYHLDILKEVFSHF